MQKFFTGVYESWQKTQQEKFRKIKNRLSKETFSQIFSVERVLDIGCGNGYLEKEYKKTKIIGVDIDLKMLSKNVCLFPRVLGSAEVLPFKKWSFDSIVSIDTMHLVHNKDFLRVLKPGGFVLFSMFFNENYEDRRKMLLDKLCQLKILEEFVLDSREKEYVVVAIKPTSRLERQHPVK